MAAGRREVSLVERRLWSVESKRRVIFSFGDTRSN